MFTSNLVSAPVIFGAFLLLWALLARRSGFDAGLLGLAGLLSIYLTVRHFPQHGLAGYSQLWPEAALGLLGLIMLIRVFLTPLGALHRIGFLIAGLVALFPVVLLVGVILLFAGFFSR